MRAGEREEVWEMGLVSVETSWNRQATGIPLGGGHTNLRMGQVPHGSESPGDIIKNSGYGAPT